jgi:hypothetical protein
MSLFIFAITPDKAWIHEQLAGVLGLVAEHVPDLDVTYRDLGGSSRLSRTGWPPSCRRCRRWPALRDACALGPAGRRAGGG